MRPTEIRLMAPPPTAWISSRARSRASASTAYRSSKCPGGAAGIASSVRSTTSGDRRERDPPAEECADRDLVGGVQHARRGAARFAGLACEAQAGEGLRVRLREGELAGLCEIERRDVHVCAVGVVKRVGDRHPHVRDTPGARATPRRSGGPARGRSTAGGRRRRSARRAVPKRWCASIISKPLFISVAESMVMRPPMSQVGCASASSGVIAGELGAAAERPAGRRQHEPLDRPGALRAHQLEERRVLRVDRDDAGVGGLGQRRHQLATHNQALLVRERELDPLASAQRRRSQPGRADDPVQNQIGVGGRRRAREPPLRHRARARSRRLARPWPPPGRLARSQEPHGRAPARPGAPSAAPPPAPRRRAPPTPRRPGAPARRSSRSSPG